MIPPYEFFSSIFLCEFLNSFFSPQLEFTSVLISYLVYIYIYIYILIFLFSPSGYISTAINDGPGCLMLRCPDPSCGAVVGQDMINVLASDEDKEKYSRYFIRSYIEDNRKVSLYLKLSWIVFCCISNKYNMWLGFWYFTNIFQWDEHMLFFFWGGGGGGE